MYTSILRYKILPLAKAIAGPSQFGAGLNGGETAFAHHIYHNRKAAASSSGLFPGTLSAAPGEGLTVRRGRRRLPLERAHT